MKAKRRHRVPLSDRALAVLREVGVRTRGWTFRSPATGGPFAETRAGVLFRKLGLEAVPHGFRSSFRGWAAENTDAPRAVMEAALAHVRPGSHGAGLRPIRSVRATPRTHAAVGRLYRRHHADEEGGRAVPKLTAAFVRTVKATDRPKRYGDGNGLYLLVKPGVRGGKSWVQRIAVHGKRRDLGLGSAELVSLADARQAAFANRRLARSGGDPRALGKRTSPTFAEASSS